MTQGQDYIVTWFYRESHEEASFYPQAGGRGDSALLQSVYMQIQVPFFTTFRHYNPQARLLFFTNLKPEALPPFLTALFRRTGTEVCTVPYRSRPPKDWYKAWMNQFYLYDILQAMEQRMTADDTLLVCDADCLCRKPLDGLFRSVRAEGSALYDMNYAPDFTINGTTQAQMDEVYAACYGAQPSSPIRYYGGEFITLRGDAVAAINRAFPALRDFNFSRPQGQARLHEEAHFLSVLAERLHLRNSTANNYVKRMWTNRHFNNVVPGDERLAVWHLPAEKKFGLRYLYRLLERDGGIRDEQTFWKKAEIYCGIPHTGLRKRVYDLTVLLKGKLK